MLNDRGSLEDAFNLGLRPEQLSPIEFLQLTKLILNA